VVSQMTSQVVAGASRQGAASEQLCKLLKRQLHVCEMLTAFHNRLKLEVNGKTEVTAIVHAYTQTIANYSLSKFKHCLIRADLSKYLLYCID